MPVPESWSAEAYNQVPQSENRIHSDEVARAYGFRGALVPGVTVSAYLLHPAALTWGRDWAERGRAHAVVRSPVYDGEPFRIDVADARSDGYEAKLFGPQGVHCASARASLPRDAAEPPSRRGDPLLSREAGRPVASRAVMEELRETGLGALPARWDEAAELTTYLRNPDRMAPVYRDEKLAHPGFVLGLTNWVLGRNVRMSPWLHLETWSQHHRAIPWGAELVVEAAIADLFEKKGHEFVDLDVGVFGRNDDDAYASVRLRAIYRMRRP